MLMLGAWWGVCSGKVADPRHREVAAGDWDSSANTLHQMPVDLLTTLEPGLAPAQRAASMPGSRAQLPGALCDPAL